MLEQLYTSEYKPFLKWVLRNNGTAEDAEDAYHSAWAVCYPLFEVRTNIDSLAQYLKTCCRNEFIRICRHKGKNLPLTWEERPDTDDFDSDESDSQPDKSAGSPMSDEKSEWGQSEEEAMAKDQILYDKDNWGIIRDCLQYLNERYRTILTFWFTLLLKYSETLTKGEITKEIAGIMATSESSINEGKSKGLEQLRHELHRRYPEKVRHLNRKFEDHQKNLKNKRSNDPGLNQK